jgi:tetratricopeptide (TPR) repeat protein
VSAAAQPIYADLDACIEACTQRIEAGDDNDRLYLYRGWAWMFKSHVRTFEKAFWSAGREAKRGKNDLEHYLELHPRDPIANSIMGAFLYFADTLPAAYKFVSKLLFLPSGDRDRGLQMMELSVGWNSLVEVDNRLVLYSVYIGFEGRYEEGMEGFDVLRRENPYHNTFLRPAGVMTTLKPRYTAAAGERLDGYVAVFDSLPPERTDRATYWLLRFMRGYADRFFNPDRAIERLEAVIEASPEHPDWVSGYAAFELGRLQASRGEFEDAHRLFLHVINDERAEYMHDNARDLIKALGKKPDPTAPDAEMVAAIYDSAESAATALAHFEAIAEPSAEELFYLGEARLATDDFDGAIEAYDMVLEAKPPHWDQEFQMIAATRAGELTGVAGEYKRSSEYFKKARERWHKEFLLDWLLEGRQRYFKRLDEGKEMPPISWFAAQ